MAHKSCLVSESLPARLAHLRLLHLCRKLLLLLLLRSGLSRLALASLVEILLRTLRTLVLERHKLLRGSRLLLMVIFRDKGSVHVIHIFNSLFLRLRLFEVLVRELNGLLGVEGLSKLLLGLSLRGLVGQSEDLLWLRKVLLLMVSCYFLWLLFRMYHSFIGLLGELQLARTLLWMLRVDVGEEAFLASKSLFARNAFEKWRVFEFSLRLMRVRMLILYWLLLGHSLESGLIVTRLRVRWHAVFLHVDWVGQVLLEVLLVLGVRDGHKGLGRLSKGTALVRLHFN